MLQVEREFMGSVRRDISKGNKELTPAPWLLETSSFSLLKKAGWFRVHLLEGGKACGQEAGSASPGHRCGRA